MVNENNSSNFVEKAEDNFEEIKESLKGLYEMLKLSFEEDDTFYRVGIENITGLYKNIVELMFNPLGTKEVIKKVRNSEINLNIDLEDYIKQDVNY